MVLKVFLHQFFRHVACAPGPVPNRPEMLAPIPSSQLWVFLLQHPGGPPFESFHQIANGFRGRVFNVHMDVILTDYSFQYSHVFRVADLHQQIPASHFDFPFQYVITIFRHPDYMGDHSRHTMRVMPIRFHAALFYHS